PQSQLTGTGGSGRAPSEQQPACYHPSPPPFTMPTARAALSLIVAVLAAGCMPKAPETPAASPVPKIAWEQKLAWIVRLEDQRLPRGSKSNAPGIIPAASTT